MEKLRLPPLTALRAFEAAARHMSFAAAADELSVTRAALSFQIKELEKLLGTPLFIRRHRAVELTEAGQILVPGTARGFTEIMNAWRMVDNHQRGNRITITTGPAFTSNWLSPRLGRFVRENPNIEIRLATSLALLDFTRDDIDLAIRFSGENTADNLFSEDLLEEIVLPVARPEIAQSLKQPRDLLNTTLIEDGSLKFLVSPPDWSSWFKAAGVRKKPKTSLSFNQADHAVDSALQGSGAVLGRFSMVSSALRNGTLIAPFPLALSTNGFFRIICPRGHEDKLTIVRFMAWLKQEVEADLELSRLFEVTD